MNRRLGPGITLPLLIGFLLFAGVARSPSVHTFASASTPPPPPTLVPTSIPPTPVPPTVTPTPTPTNTPTPTATTGPLGAPVRIVASASVHHLGKTAVLRWRMAYQRGIKGFHIYSGSQRLTRSLIRPHQSPNYVVQVPWVRSGRYALVVLFQNGHSQRVPVH